MPPDNILQACVVCNVFQQEIHLIQEDGKSYCLKCLTLRMEQDEYVYG